MKHPRFSDSPAFTLALAIVTPAIFVWGRNWHKYTWPSMGLSFCVLLAVAVLVYAAARLLSALYYRKAEMLPGWSHRLICFFVCAVVVLIIRFLLSVSFSGVSIAYRWYVVPIGGIILAATVVFRAGFRALNLFLAICLLLFFGSGAVNVFQYYRSQQNAVRADSTGIRSQQNAVRADSTRITLKTKPNIYLYWLESYHSLPIMREVYGIDIEPLYDYLRDRQFFIYDNVYSNSFYTLASMTDLYTMIPQFSPKRGNLDIGPTGHAAISGNEANAVYRMLKDNGYYTIVVDRYTNARGVNLDEEINTKPILVAPLLDLNKRLPFGHNRVNYNDTLFRSIKLAMKKGRQRNQPFYLDFKSGANHVNNKTHTWKDKEKWVTGGIYQELVKISSQELTDIVDYIVAEDPGSVIILLGDHGPWRLHGIWDEANDLSELESILHENGESMKSLADDIFGVLMAIRMPDGARDISYGFPMSQINLFRHIFAALSDDAEILKERQPSWSILKERQPLNSILTGGLILVKEGIVQSTP